MIYFLANEIMSDKPDEEMLQDVISSCGITAENKSIEGGQETSHDAMHVVSEPVVEICIESNENRETLIQNELNLFDSRREEGQENEDGSKTVIEGNVHEKNVASIYEGNSEKETSNDVEKLFASLRGELTDNESSQKETEIGTHNQPKESNSVNDKKQVFRVFDVVEMKEIGQEQIIVDLPSLSKSKKRSRKKRDSSTKKVIPSEPPTVQCSFCVKKFHTDDEKARHEKYHTEEQPFKCLYCGKRFTTVGGQRRHERKFHTGEKLLKCKFCEKTFATSTAIRRHERVHTDDRPYGCVMCDATFKDSTDLRRHERRHTGEKPFKCKICDRAFTVRSAMNRHQRVHTGAKPYLCDLCGHAFTDRFSLKQHIKGHSRGILYECGVCGEGFSFRYHLHTHKRGCGDHLTLKDVEEKVTASKAAENETTTFLELTESIVGSQTVYYVNPISVTSQVIEQCSSAVVP